MKKCLRQVAVKEIPPALQDGEVLNENSELN